MERLRDILLEIASAANKVITTANKYADCQDALTVSRSHFQLEEEMQRVCVACECGVEALETSTFSDGSSESFDCFRLWDWLSSDDPQQCLHTLTSMKELLQDGVLASVVSDQTLLGGWGTASAEDKIEQAVRHFDTRKTCFRFLLTTEIPFYTQNAQRKKHQDVESKYDGFYHITSVRGTGSTTTIPYSSIHQDVHVNSCNQQVSDSLEGSRTSLIPTTPSQTSDANEKLKDIIVWLDGLNCAEKHDDTLSLRQPDTCKWLFNAAKYKKWRNHEISFLWLKGKPGTGKSVLASSIIDSLEASLRKGEVLAFFYCDFQHKQSTSSVEVLRSILSQLLRGLVGSATDIASLESLLEDFERVKGQCDMRGNVKELAQFISRVARLSGVMPLVVIDALDECEDVRILIHALMVFKDHVQLFITSQPLRIIAENLSGLSFISMDDMEYELSADIQLHITRELSARYRLRSLHTDFKSDIHSVLCAKACGMFRWIQYSLDTLSRCVTRTEIRSALDNIPEGLEKTYERSLRAIGARGRKAQLARQAITWLMAAVRPLRINELMEGLSINLQTRSFDPNFERMHYEAVLDACGSLVVYNETTGIIVLCHPSVKEYLMSLLIPKALRRYRVNLKRAHLLLARSCLYYLCISLNSASSNTFRDIPQDPLGTSSMLTDHLRTMAPPLLDYVLNNALDHFKYLGSQFKLRVVLEDIQVLANAIQQYPRTWDNLCQSTSCTAGPITTPGWPTSKHDLALYILVAHGSNSLLHECLCTLKPKEGTNPLVYAAHFNREEHAQILLSEGAGLNDRGWDIEGLSQVIPIEVAVRRQHLSMVGFFLEEGSSVPPHIFTISFFQMHQLRIPSSLARMLLQSDAFAEAANCPFDDDHDALISQPLDIINSLLEMEATDENDLKAILRRLNQLVDLDAQENTELLHLAIQKKWRSLIQYLLVLGVSLPSDKLVRYSSSEASWRSEVIDFLVGQMM